MNREKLNIKISELVDVLRTEEDRRITMSDIASITEVLITTMSRYFASIDTSMYREFQDLSDHIIAMRTEIARAQPKEIKAKKIPRAGRELDAVVQATEDATNTIMEAVETIMAADTTDAEAYALAVNDQCMRIFEACSFQDITGQRVTKVINTLTFIEERIGSILTAWPEGEDMADDESAEPETAAAPGDRELLNGPALDGEGISQNDVDSLFDEESPPAEEAAPEPAPEAAPEPEPAPEPAKAEEAAPAEAPEPAPDTAPEPAKAEEAAPEPVPETAPEPAKAKEAAPAKAPEPAPEAAPEPEPAKAEQPAPAEVAKAVVEDAGETETEVVKAVAKATAKPAPAAKGNGAAAKLGKSPPAPAAKPKPAAAAKSNGAAKPKPAAAKASADDDDDDDARKSSQDDIDALFD